MALELQSINGNPLPLYCFLNTLLEEVSVLSRSLPVEELGGKLAIKPVVVDALCEYDLQHAVSGGALRWRHS